jgi:hypothetical protein
MENHIFKFNIDLNKNLLLEELYKCLPNVIEYKDVRKDSFFSNWKIVKHSFPYADHIIDLLKLSKFDVRPRYYILDKNTTLKMHKDLGTLCSVNIILSEDPAPINIEGTNYYYKQALINTQARHGVTEPSPLDRLLFKLSIMDCDFISAKNLISSNLPILE